MARLIHLNGTPGIGKSTLARRYAADHPLVLNCDVDVLRTLVGGWQQDFGQAGQLIRPAALAFIGAYLETGHDVVLPQLIVRADELRRFERAAGSAGAEFVEVFLMDDRDRAVARFERRGDTEPADPWHDQVRVLVAAEGGPDLLRRYHDGLESLLRDRSGALVINSREGEADQTYQDLRSALDPPPPR